MSLHRVAVLVRDGVMPLEVGIAHQILGRARSAAGEPLYDVVTCAVRPGVIRTDVDVTLNVRRGPAALARADTVIVPAAHDAVEHTGRLDPPLAAALRRIRRGTRVASICTGSFVLAAAGRLDGVRATTHWISCDAFRRLFPAVELDPDVLWTQARTDAGEVLTSGGEAAGIDLCLHLVRQDHGAAVANEVARLTLVPPYREGGQAQYTELPVPAPARSSTGAVREWALDHLDEPLSLAGLAARAGFSVRTFTRRFRAETGESPAQWLTRRRVDRARHLLETSDRPVDRVALDAGFGTGVSLRQHFQAALGTTPSAYRATFRG